MAKWLQDKSITKWSRIVQETNRLLKPNYYNSQKENRRTILRTPKTIGKTTFHHSGTSFPHFSFKNQLQKT